MPNPKTNRRVMTPGLMVTPREPRRRVTVRCSTKTHLDLKPLLLHRRGADRIVEEAERLTLEQVLKLLRSETPPTSGNYPTLQLYLTDEVERRADSFDLPPHLLLRAAAVKIAADLNSTEATQVTSAV